MRILFLCIVLSAQTRGEEHTTAESLSAPTAQTVGVESTTTESLSASTAETHTGESITTASPSPSTAETHTSEGITTVSPSALTVLLTQANKGTTTPIASASSVLLTQAIKGTTTPIASASSVLLTQANKGATTPIASASSELPSVVQSSTAIPQINTTVREELSSVVQSSTAIPQLHTTVREDEDRVSRPHFNYTIQMEENRTSINFLCISATGLLPITYRIFQNMTNLLKNQTVNESVPLQYKMFVTPPTGPTVYKCEAQNTFGMQYSQFKEINIGPVSRPHFSYTIQKKEKNMSVNFACISETGSLPITYRIFQNVKTLVKELEVFERAPFYYKMFVTLPMGPSVYKCKAQNMLGVMYSQEINIGPVSKPHFNYTIQMEGNRTSIHFFCISAAGSLPITYRILESKTTLVDEQTVKESAPFQCKTFVTLPTGYVAYSCEAKNILGVEYSQSKKINIDKPASEKSKIVFYSSTALFLLLLIILPCACVCIILVCKFRKTHL
ncbi:uncharacterized protein LOC122799242 isoform X2 [Protopterus annectens]|uniref:uncharacterized protein LOC122799242 isoform X2 n=1 Tax=Protopterus annectens TaxID=7888 RepID=UPI001CFBE1A2|nr:uncharacterized protein LOC122799242 isoform X2 [Protopterus annectens]